MAREPTIEHTEVIQVKMRLELSDTSTACLWILLFCSMLFYYNNDEKNLSIPSWGYCLCGVFMFHPCLNGFSLGTLVSSQILKTWPWGELACLPCPSLSECRCVWERPAVEAPLGQGASCLVCWAARRCFYHPYLWTAGSGSGNHYLTCF